MFLLLRTVVPAVSNMGEKVLLTMRALREAAKRERRAEGEKPNDP